MYLSAELIALANQQVQETFAQASVAWQAIPHWDTGDPGQTKIRQDLMWATTAPPWVGASLTVKEESKSFNVSLAQATVAAPDALLAVVISKTVELATAVDAFVIPKLYTAGKMQNIGPKTEDILAQLIIARVSLENIGYRAPGCLLVSTAALTALNTLDGGYSVLEPLLTAANVNSLFRVDALDPAIPPTKLYALMLGRRQLIPHGGAASASAGEEPVDIAFSVLPSVEVVGEAASGNIELAVRTRYAVRVKDARGVAIVHTK
jgi:hypothetical protein